MFSAQFPHLLHLQVSFQSVSWADMMAKMAMSAIHFVVDSRLLFAAQYEHESSSHPCLQQMQAIADVPWRRGPSGSPGFLVTHVCVRSRLSSI